MFSFWILPWKLKEKQRKKVIYDDGALTKVNLLKLCKFISNISCLLLLVQNDQIELVQFYVFINNF